jgi:hypothetical protein
MICLLKSVHQIHLCKWLLLIATLALSIAEVQAAQWTSIELQTCSQNSTSFGDTNVSCSGFSKTEYRDTITFYASAYCESACDNQGVTTSLKLVIGTSGPCTYPVSYTFWGGVQGPTSNPPYVYANMYANSSEAYVSASSSKDCNQVPSSTGSGSFPYPC